MSKNTKSAKGGAENEAPKKDERGFMQHYIQDPIDGAAMSISGGPFGLLRSQLIPDPPSGSKNGYTYLGVIPAKDPNAPDDDDGPGAPGATPGGKKKHGRGA